MISSINSNSCLVIFTNVFIGLYHAILIVTNVFIGLYHAILEMKCVPFLDSVPFHPHHDLELYQLKDVMTPHVLAIPVLAPAHAIHELLQGCHHNAFAVVNADGAFLGSISRATCEVLLNS